MTRGLIAGIDLGASNVRVAIVNHDGEVQARRPMPYGGGAPGELLDRLADTVGQLARSVWVGGAVDAIGMALPGAVNPQRGTVASAANLPGWDDVHLVDDLRGRCGVPVAIDNDANAAALGEGWLGAAKGLRDFVFIALGTGIGSGVVLDGRLRRGPHFLAGEVAFFAMTPDHVRAPGWDACLEGVAGGRAYDRMARELLGAHASGRDLFAAARGGDAAAQRAVRNGQEYLAMAIADVIAVLDLEAVVFGGGVAAAQGEWFLAPVREMALRCVPSRPWLVLSSLGEDAQLLGAVRLALDSLEARGAAK